MAVTRKAINEILKVVKLHDHVITELNDVITGFGQQFYSLNNGCLEINSNKLIIKKYSIYNNEEIEIQLYYLGKFK